MEENLQTTQFPFALYLPCRPVLHKYACILQACIQACKDKREITEPEVIRHSPLQPSCVLLKEKLLQTSLFILQSCKNTSNCR